jgi:hypothetical protein
MFSERKNSARILLSLESREYVCFSNVLNEVCNGFLASDFSNRIGLSRQEADNLRKTIQKHSSGGSARLELTRRELLAIRNSLTESIRELGVEEFHTRVGIFLQDGEQIGRDIDRVLESTGST